MKTMTRRNFLRATATGVALMPTLPARSTVPAKIKLGLIGCGWYGLVDLKAAFKAGGVEVVALCDVDRQHLAESAAQVEKLQGARPRTFKHYQDMLQLPALQAVIIATPPHWHALPFLASLKRGLDIYCEKPLAYDIREGRAMVEAARRSDRVVQIGFQRRESQAIRQARDYIQSGQAGRIVQVEAQIHYKASLRDTTPQDPPASLDWDLWCGPAPKLPYCPQIGHFAWRLEKAYGHGHLVDWGIHLIDASRWILEETTPHTLQAAGGIYYFKGKITTPDVLVAHLDFKRCPLTWRHRIWGAAEYTPEVSNGIFFYGEQKTVFVTDRRWVVVSHDKKKPHEVHEVPTDMATRHMADFLDAVRTRRSPDCPIEEGYRSTATVQLAMIAYESGTRVRWDEKREQIVDNPAASRLLRRAYRKPWRHPYQG